MGVCMYGRRERTETRTSGCNAERLFIESSEEF
jgi:hypothetical protein